MIISVDSEGNAADQDQSLSVQYNGENKEEWDPVNYSHVTHPVHIKYVGIYQSLKRSLSHMHSRHATQGEAHVQMLYLWKA